MPRVCQTMNNGVNNFETQYMSLSLHTLSIDFQFDDILSNIDAVSINFKFNDIM